MIHDSWNKDALRADVEEADIEDLAVKLSPRRLFIRRENDLRNDCDAEL
jgi:hypothetical protein